MNIIFIILICCISTNILVWDAHPQYMPYKNTIDDSAEELALQLIELLFDGKYDEMKVVISNIENEKIKHEFMDNIDSLINEYYIPEKYQFDIEWSSLLPFEKKAFIERHGLQKTIEIMDEQLNMVNQLFIDFHIEESLKNNAKLKKIFYIFIGSRHNPYIISELLDFIKQGKDLFVEPEIYNALFNSEGIAKCYLYEPYSKKFKLNNFYDLEHQKRITKCMNKLFELKNTKKILRDRALVYLHFANKTRSNSESKLYLLLAEMYQAFLYGDLRYSFIASWPDYLQIGIYAPDHKLEVKEAYRNLRTVDTNLLVNLTLKINDPLINSLKKRIYTIFTDENPPCKF